jgi:hypothetical protein
MPTKVQPRRRSPPTGHSHSSAETAVEKTPTRGESQKSAAQLGRSGRNLPLRMWWYTKVTCKCDPASAHERILTPKAHKLKLIENVLKYH